MYARFRGAVSYLRGQSPEPLYIVGVIDDIAHALDIPVEALHRVKGGVEALPPHDIPDPAYAGLEGVRQAVYGCGQSVHFRVYVQPLADERGKAVLQRHILHICGLEGPAQQAFPLCIIKMREISVPVVHRLIAVSYAYLVHQREQLVIDFPELLDGGCDFLLVQARAFGPEVVHQRAPLAQAVAVAPIAAPSFELLLYHGDVVQGLAVYLHSRGLAHRIALAGLSVKVEFSHSVAQLRLVYRAARLVLVYRREICLDDLLRRRAVKNIAGVPLLCLAHIGRAAALVLHPACTRQYVVSLCAESCAPLCVEFLKSAGEGLIFPLGRVYFRNACAVCGRGQVLGADLPAHELPKQLPVPVAQEVAPHGALIGPPRLFALIP